MGPLSLTIKSMKKVLMIVVAVAVIILVGYGLSTQNSDNPTVPTNDNKVNTVSTTTVEVTQAAEGEEVVIGTSVEGRDIVAYNYGSGDKRVLVIGGVHGGYSWNTALLGYELKDHFKAQVGTIPEDVTVTIIPVLNPDGLEAAVGTDGMFSASDVSTSQSVLVGSRTNANKVDLSRNFDCNWKADAVWQTKPISGGTAAFSEPEAAAIRDYVGSHEIESAVVLYSAAGGVYASKCGGSTMSDTTTLMNTYAKASGYPGKDSYDYYETSGDLVSWLAKQEIPAISVLLTNHTATEFSKNLKGLEAVINAAK